MYLGIATIKTFELIFDIYQGLTPEEFAEFSQKGITASIICKMSSGKILHNMQKMYNVLAKEYSGSHLLGLFRIAIDEAVERLSAEIHHLFGEFKFSEGFQLLCSSLDIHCRLFSTFSFNARIGFYFIKVSNICSTFKEISYRDLEPSNLFEVSITHSREVLFCELITSSDKEECLRIMRQFNEVFDQISSKCEEDDYYPWVYEHYETKHKEKTCSVFIELLSSQPRI